MFPNGGCIRARYNMVGRKRLSGTRHTDCVALVTARGGSKRLPGKNIRQLGGRPLIAWSIAAALKSLHVRRVIVSTDCVEIAEAARQAGGEVPFLRPPELSGDHAAHHDVVAHAVDWLERDEGRLPEFLCLLQPTSPLRSASDIDATLDLIIETEADCAFAVSSVTTHPALMYRLDGPKASPYLPPREGYVRTQDLDPLYYVNGAVYVVRPSSFRERSTLLSQHPVAYVMNHERAVDIDHEWDFRLAEILFGMRSD